MQKQVILTAQGLKQITDELEDLKSLKREEVAEKIKQARSFGDLSENSEYDEAKNEQAMVESRIAELENMLKVAVVLNKDQIPERRRLPGHVRKSKNHGRRNGRNSPVPDRSAPPKRTPWRAAFRMRARSARRL